MKGDQGEIPVAFLEKKMSYPVSYRRGAAGGAGGFRPGAGGKWLSSSAFEAPPQKWLDPGEYFQKRHFKGASGVPRIPRGAGAALKAAGRMSPLYRAYQGVKALQNIASLLGEIPAGYEVPSGWVLCNNLSACAIPPDGHYLPSGTTCLPGATSCLGGQATLLARPGPPGPPPDTNHDQRVIFVRRTSDADWGMTGFRCTWVRMYARPTAPAIGDPYPYYREAQQPIYWPETLPEVQPMLDPEALPIGQPVPTPEALPYGLVPYRQPNIWRGRTYQTQFGNGLPAVRDVQEHTTGRVISVDPSGRVEVQPVTRKHDRNPPVKTRTTIERKVYLRAAGKASKLYRIANFGLGTATEALDFLAMLYDQVPQEAKTAWISRNVRRGDKLDIYDIITMVVLNLDQIDVATAIVAYGKMQLEDVLWAQYGRLVAKSTPIGGTGVHDQITEALDIPLPSAIPSDWSARYDRLEADLITQIRRVI